MWHFRSWQRSKNRRTSGDDKKNIKEKTSYVHTKPNIKREVEHIKISAPILATTNSKYMDFSLLPFNQSSNINRKFNNEESIPRIRVGPERGNNYGNVPTINVQNKKHESMMKEHDNESERLQHLLVGKMKLGRSNTIKSNKQASHKSIEIIRVNQNNISLRNAQILRRDKTNKLAEDHIMNAPKTKSLDPRSNSGAKGAEKKTVSPSDTSFSNQNIKMNVFERSSREDMHQDLKSGTGGPNIKVDYSLKAVAAKPVTSESLARPVIYQGRSAKEQNRTSIDNLKTAKAESEESKASEEVHDEKPILEKEQPEASNAEVDDTHQKNETEKDGKAKKLYAHIITVSESEISSDKTLKGESHGIVRQEEMGVPLETIPSDDEIDSESTNVSITGIDQEIMHDLKDPSSSLYALFSEKHISTDDPNYPIARLAHLKETAIEIYNSSFEGTEPKDYLTFLGGGMNKDDNSPLDSDIIRTFYMSKFRWNYDMLSSLRILCDKLFFKGESQYIDRIIDSFSKSWFEVFGICNRKSLFGSPNGVYLVAYSLIILNTDLHTKSRGNEKVRRITKSKFVKNTIAAMKQGNVPFSNFKLLEHELKNFYASVASNELHLTDDTSMQIGASGKLSNGHVIASKSDSILSSIDEIPQSNLRPRQSISSLFSRGEHDKADDLSLFSSAATADNTPSSSFGFAKAIRAESSLTASESSRNSMYSFGAGSTFTTGSFNASILTRFSSKNQGPLNPDFSLTVGDSTLNDPYFVEEDGDVELEMGGPPWIKEGIQKVVLTHSVIQSMNSSKQSSVSGSLSSLNEIFKHSNLRFSGFSAGSKIPWRDHFTVVSEGQLRLFTFDKSAGRMNGPRNKGNGNWTDSATCIATVTLNSCYAQVVRPKSKLYAHILKHMQRITIRTKEETFWVLNLPLNDSNTFMNYRRIFFCSGTMQNAAEFCDSCNFWAARTSSIPPEETISSIEYGWSDKMFQVMDGSNSGSTGRAKAEQYLSSVIIQKWQPVVYGLIASENSMIEQLNQLKQYHCNLQITCRKHRELGVFQDRLESFAGGSRARQGRNGFFGRNKKVGNTSSNVRVIRKNYVNRLNYLSNEFLKFGSYIAIMQSAIALRRKKLAEAEERDNIIKEEEEEEEKNNDDDDDQKFKDSRSELQGEAKNKVVSA